MGIIDLFKPKPDPEPDREGGLRDPEQILAWLEELCRIRTDLEVTLSAGDQVPIPAKISQVGEETRSVTLGLARAPHPEPSPGHRAHLVFHLDGRRYEAGLAYQGRGGYLEYRFALPRGIRHGERRDSVRAHFRTREQASILVLQDLFSGLGLSGGLVDLSMGGCAFHIQRAIQVQTQKRLPLRSDLLPPGTSLALVRLPDLPRMPVVECGGVVANLREGPLGPVMGIAFRRQGAMEAQILARFLANKVPGFRLDFPRKRRYKDLTEAELELPQPESPTSELPEEPAPSPDEAVQAFTDHQLSEFIAADPALQGPDRLKLLRMRGKKILLVVGDPLARTILAGACYGAGYRCIFEANSLIQALDAHRRVALDLLLVDQTVGARTALELIEALRAQGLAKQVPVIVLQRQVDVRLTVAARAGGISLLAPQPVDFRADLEGPMETLLGIR